MSEANEKDLLLGQRNSETQKGRKKRHIEYSWTVSRQDLNELKVKHKYLFSCDCSDILDGLCSVNIKNEEKLLNNLHQISVI